MENTIHTRESDGTTSWSRELSYRFKQITYLGIAVPFAYWVLTSAFSNRSRKEIGRRDNWTCQEETCDDGNGRPRRFQDGWMVHAAHYDHRRQTPHYDSPDNGRILCVDHHIEDHRDRVGFFERIGDYFAARREAKAVELLENTDRRTYRG